MSDIYELERRKTAARERYQFLAATNVPYGPDKGHERADLDIAYRVAEREYRAAMAAYDQALDELAATPER
jgi:hypothetical protein